jgi:predicted O-methyltransferase YrrM
MVDRERATGGGGPPAYPRLLWSNLSLALQPGFHIFASRVPRRLARPLEQGRYRVALHGRGTFVECADAEELVFALAARHVGRAFLPAADADRAVGPLLEMHRYARRAILDRYSAEEIRRKGVGGWPSVKEITLHTLVRRFRPRRVIETGVAQGISSMFLLDALAQNGEGQLISIDLPNFNPEGFDNQDGTRARTFVKEQLGVGWLVPERLRANWTLILKPAQEALLELDAPVDLFYHDSLHTYAHMRFEYDWAWRHLGPGGLLASDDIRWNRAFPDFVRDHRGELRVLLSHGLGLVARRTAPSAS